MALTTNDTNALRGAIPDPTAATNVIEILNTGIASSTPSQVAATGSVTSSGATAGVGYATGAGGTVTQGTSKSTGVTLSKVCGQITTHAANLASLAIVSFTLTNTAIAAGDVLVLNHISGNSGVVPAQRPFGGRFGDNRHHEHLRRHTR